MKQVTYDPESNEFSDGGYLHWFVNLLKVIKAFYAEEVPREEVELLAGDNEEDDHYVQAALDTKGPVSRVKLVGSADLCFVPGLRLLRFGTFTWANRSKSRHLSMDLWLRSNRRVTVR
ncbi:hypothetical protein WJX73_003223 [Symbiochloris irregularis]|uniref:Uncharacterized protein n=1 Tax=Symbiochloris irregularis TaxID=706552 RepID=A0AAW1NW70_9CHLO